MERWIKDHLIFIKRMFKHAQEHAEINIIVDRENAILGFDQTVEMLLSTIISHLDKTVKKDDNNFGSLLGLADTLYNTKTGTNLPHINQIKSMHVLRNQIQHHGQTVDEKQVNKYKFIIEGFIEEVVEAVFDIAYDEISFLYLIEDLHLKEIMTKSKQYLDEQNHSESIIHSKHAHHIIIQKMIKKKMALKDKAYIYSFPPKIHLGNDGLENIIKHIIERINELENIIQAESLGLNTFDHHRFKHLPVNIYIDGYGKPHITIVESFIFKDDDAMFAFNFALNEILKFEKMQF